MRRRRKIKILATLGPSSADRATIKALFEAGADVFRLNMSHGTHDDILKKHTYIREIEEEVGRPIGILADLQGPKLRVGEFQEKAYILEEGQEFTLDLDPTPGDAKRVNLPHPEILSVLSIGDSLLVNDGKIRLSVTQALAEKVVTKVIVGGEISNRKGVNVPDVELPVAALSEKDRRDLEFVCNLGIDWLALSFVQRPEDVREARELVKDRAYIMAKIEKPKAVERIMAITEVSDGIMVARGDLGVELPVSEVPPVQKRLIRTARSYGKPVVVATQMLESMIKSPVPTRAEVSDVANAIYEGADAVMLSAESAAGDYPLEAVKTMDSVAITIESDPPYRRIIEAGRPPADPTVADAITAAAREVAETAHVRAICTFTHSGTTALRCARERPRVPILAMTPVKKTARRLCLAWGLHCIICSPVNRFKAAVAESLHYVVEDGFACEGDKVIVTAGVPFNVPGTTNILRVSYVGEKLSVEEEKQY